MLYETTAAMKAAASSQMRIVPDAELAIRQLASVLKNDTASEEEVVSALRHWARVVVEQRQHVYSGASIAAQPARNQQINDVVEVSQQARAKLLRW